MKKNHFFYILLFVSSSVLASFPTGYYNSTEGLKSQALKTALHNIICEDTTQYLDYGSGKGKTWEGFYYTDRVAATHAVIDMYSPTIRYFPNPNPTFVSFGQDIHIEHSLPKSWWKCDIDHPDCPAKDLNHLFPADGSTNTSKNDNPLGVVTGTPTLNNGVSKIGPAIYDGYVGNVFEPADQYKGDFARAYFYMATAYEHYKYKWDTSKPENMMESNSYPVFKPWALELLLQWHRQDPVSNKEVVRNDVVYGIQKNRNPFIDFPKLVEYIWGDRTYIPFHLDGSINFPYLKWPNDNDTLQLGKIYFDQKKDTIVLLKAINITGDLNLSIGGINAALFSLNKSTISKAEAEAGYSIKLQYQALALGNHSAILTISGGGIEPTFIKLQAFSSDEFVALSPQSTTDKGFVAQWTPSKLATGYSLNVFTKNQTGETTAKTLLEEEFILALPNTWSKEGYTENITGTIRLASGSSYGKISLPTFDLSTATSNITIKAKQYSNDAGANLMVSIDNQALITWTTGVNYQDFSVNIPISTPISKISLSAIAGKRVYIDYVKLVSLIPVMSSSPVSGFPKTVGNLYSFPVEGLLSASKYYYTVTPIGNDGSISNQVEVITSVNTRKTETGSDNFKIDILPQGIYVNDITKNSKLYLMDTLGRIVVTSFPKSSEILLPLSKKGLYLLLIEQNNQTKAFKIRY